MIRDLNFKCGSWLRAEKKAGEMSPLVRVCASPSSAWSAFYSVRGSGGSFYRVALARRADGSPCASCSCPSGVSASSSVFCYHVAAVVALHSAFVSSGVRPALLPFPASPEAETTETETAQIAPFCYRCDVAPSEWIDEAERIISEMPDDEADEERWQKIFDSAPDDVRALGKIRSVARFLDSIENENEIDISDICGISRTLYGVLNSEVIQ